MNEITKEGKTRKEALSAALEELGVEEDQVDVEVITPAREGLFGFLSSRGVKIRVTLKKGVVSGRKPELGNEAVALRDDYTDTPEGYVNDFLLKVIDCLGVKCDVEVHEGEQDIFVDISGKDSGVIIGKFGQTLDSLQYLTNVIIGKKFGNKKKIIMDVGDYRERREISVKKLARSVARKVVSSRKSEALSPMSPQDRRTVHLALTNFKDVETTSEGTGLNRKVVISYKQ